MAVQWCVDLVRSATGRVIDQINLGEFADFNEATIQHHLALNLHLDALFRHQQDVGVKLEKVVRRPEGQLFPKKNRNSANIDLFFTDEEGTRCAIELKCFHRNNQREPNNRCDAYLDLANLETYLEEHADVGLFILVTNHPHYFDPELPPMGAAAADFNTRQGHRYEGGTELTYVGTGPYRDTTINLLGTYEFDWINERNIARVLILEVLPNPPVLDRPVV